MKLNYLYYTIKVTIRIVTKVLRKSALVPEVYSSDLKFLSRSSPIDTLLYKGEIAFSMLYFSKCRTHSVALKQRDVWERSYVIMLFVQPCSGTG